jgi:putative transposase
VAVIIASLSIRKKNRIQRETREEVQEILLKAFQNKRRKKRGIPNKNDVDRRFQIVYNLKKNTTIMNKYNTVCPI